MVWLCQWGHADRNTGIVILMDCRCIGSIIQRDKINGEYTATLIFEDKNWRYKFTMSTMSKVKAQLWVDNNTNQMPQYYDRMTRVQRDCF